MALENPLTPDRSTAFEAADDDALVLPGLGDAELGRKILVVELQSRLQLRN